MVGERKPKAKALPFEVNKSAAHFKVFGALPFEKWRELPSPLVWH